MFNKEIAENGMILANMHDNEKTVLKAVY